jgi:hypothetical protein
MEPNTGVLAACLIFTALYIAFDRVASTMQTKYREEADVEKKKLEAASLENMGTKLVETMQLMHGGLLGDAVRRMPGVTIDPEGREANGRNTVQYPRSDNGAQHRGAVPADFPGATAGQAR